MDRYRAVTDMRFDWRSERVSWDDIVFWREMGWKEDEEEVEVLEFLEAGCSIVATGILSSRRPRDRRGREDKGDRRQRRDGTTKRKRQTG